MTIEGPRRHPAPRWAVLSLLASLSSVSGDSWAAEGYALELLTTADSGWSWRA